jgi:hypothetical protein
VVVLVPVVAFHFRGFDWEAALYATPVVMLLLAVAQRRWMVPVVASIVLAVGLLVAVEGWNLIDYHTYALNGPPDQVSWCGQTFFPEENSGGVPDPLPVDHLSEVLVTPSGTAIYSHGGCPTGRLSLIYARKANGVVTYLEPP